MKDDITGEELYQRDDDTRHALVKRYNNLQMRGYFVSSFQCEGGICFQARRSPESRIKSVLSLFRFPHLGVSERGKPISFFFLSGKGVVGQLPLRQGGEFLF